MTNSTKESSSSKIWLIIGGVIIIIALLLLGYKISDVSIFGIKLVPPEATASTQTGNASSSGTLLLDGFDKSNYDGKYNSTLWGCFGCDEFGVVTATQGNGAIRLDATNKGNFENHSGGLVSQLSWLPNEIGYLEAKMKLLSTDSGGVNILLRVPLEATEWAASCWIQRFSETQAEYACDVSTFVNQQYVGEYKTESFPIKYDEWHIAKIELTPNTFKLRFYLDGELIGEHTPADVDLLKTKHLSASFGVYTDTKITAFIDDYIVSNAP